MTPIQADIILGIIFKCSNFKNHKHARAVQLNFHK